MKFLIFTFVVAFILQDYGTFQIESLAGRSTSELAEIFKEHALELVTAAIKPLDKNDEITEGGLDCINMAKKEGNWSPFDQILAIMSIAKDYKNDLEIIRKTAKLSTIKIDEGLMKNIRAIVLGHEHWPGLDGNFSTDPAALGKQYLKVITRKAPGTNSSEECWKPDVDCYRSILSIYKGDNKGFFDPLAEGLVIVGTLISGDAEDSKNDRAKTRLNEIIGSISKFELSAYNSDDALDEFDDLLDSLDEVRKGDSDEENDTDDD